MFTTVRESLTGSAMALDNWWDPSKLGGGFRLRLQYVITSPLAGDISAIKATIEAGVMTAEEGNHEDPQMIFTISADDFLVMLNRIIPSPTLFMQRRLVVSYGSGDGHTSMLSHLNKSRRT